MANDLVDGRLYLLEDEGSWVPTVADIDLATDFTEGTDFCQFKAPRQFVVNGFTGITIEHASGGKGFMTRTYRRGYIVEFQSEEAQADLANIHNFIMTNVHVTSDPATYVPYFLIFRRTVSDYWTFYDHAGTSRSYLKGAVIQGGLQITWNETSNQRVLLKVKFVGWVP